MSQRSDELEARDPSTSAPPRSNHQDMGNTDVTSADIEQTRAEMSGTIAAISEKINPHALAREAKETVPEIAAEVAQHAKEAFSEAAANAAQHIKDVAADLVQHVKETLPEVASNAAHRAVGGAINEAKDAVQKAYHSSVDAMGDAVNTAKGASMTLAERIKQNPIPTALVGAGLYWLYRGGQNNHASISQTNGSNGSNGIGQTMHNATSKMSEVAGQVHDKAGDLMEQVQGKAGAVASKVQDTAGTVASKVQDTAGAVASKVQDTAHQSTDWFQQMMRDNPLAVGAMALVAGAVIGLTIPETDREDRIMGKAKDKLAHKAQDAVHSLGDKVQTVAHEAMSKVAEEAKNQGLTVQS